VALKKPGDLFARKRDVIQDNSPNVNESISKIRNQFSKVDELKKQLEDVSSSLNESLTEVVDNNVNIVSLQTQYNEVIEKLNKKIERVKEEFSNEVKALRKSNSNLSTEITILEKRQKGIKLSDLREDIIVDVQNLLKGNVLDNIKHLEERVNIINEKHVKVLTESYNEPPSVKNSDPLTPLDRNFVNLQDFQEHYRLFLTRIQRQLSTLGGGGAVLVSDLDDVDTTTAKVDNKFLKYNASLGKWVGSDTAGGGYTLPTASATTLGGIKIGSGLSIDGNGVVTASGGSGSIAGISTTGTSVFNQINASGIVTASTFVGDGSGLTGIVGSGSGVVVKDSGSTVGTAGTINFGSNLSVSAISAGIVTVTGSAGAASTEHISAQTLSVAGVTTFNNADVIFQGAAGGQNITFDASENDLEFTDAARIKFGNNDDLEIWHDAPNSNIKNSTGDFHIRSDSLALKTADNSDRYLKATKNEDVKLYWNGNEKFATTNTGAVVTGILTATSFSGDGSELTGISASADVVSDTSPQLGGNLDVNGKDIVSTSNGDIDLAPNGTGAVVFKGVSGNGGNGAGRFKLNCEVNSHGITIQGPPHSAGANYTLTLPNTDGNANQVLKTNGSGVLDWVDQASSGLGSRQQNSTTTGSLSQNSTTNTAITTAGKSFALLSITVSAPAYVVLYIDAASRTADSGRGEGTDPAPGSGVLTEVSTTANGSTTFLMTPAVLGWNNDSTPTAQVHAKIKNKRTTSGSNSITVTLKTLALEA